MSFFLVSNIKLRPLTIPIKGDRIRTLILLIQTAEVFVFDTPNTLDIKKTECDLILCIGLNKEVFKCSPIADCNLASPSAVGDLEKEAILISLNLGLLLTIPQLATAHIQFTMTILSSKKCLHSLRQGVRLPQ